jgi:hypothetical protein
LTRDDQSNTEKRHTRMERVGLAKPMRLYVIRDTILSDAED